jgi:hypothetical protein
MIKIKRKIDNAVAGQLRKIISSFDRDDMKSILEDQKVEVVRMKARTKQEFNKLKAMWWLSFIFVLWFWFIFLNRPLYLAVKQALKF